MDVFQPPVQTCSESYTPLMTATSTAVEPSTLNRSTWEDSQTGTELPSSQFSSILSQNNSLTPTVSGESSLTDTKATPSGSEAVSRTCTQISLSDVSVETVTNGNSRTTDLVLSNGFDANDDGESVLSTASSGVDTGYSSTSTSVAPGEERGAGINPRKDNEEERGKVPTSYVMGRQQDVDKCPPQFYLKPCDREGRNLNKPLGQRFEDFGMKTFLNIGIQ